MELFGDSETGQVVRVEIQTVDKEVEIPQIQVVDKIIEVRPRRAAGPSLGTCKGGRRARKIGSTSRLRFLR